jgi:hypothetical protein
MECAWTDLRSDRRSSRYRIERNAISAGKAINAARMAPVVTAPSREPR